MRAVLVNPAHEHDWKEIEPHFREFEDAIPAWIYTVEFVSGNGEFIMRATVDDTRGKLRLERGSQFASETEVEERRQIVLHEIMHCYTVPQKWHTQQVCDSLGVDGSMRNLILGGADDAMERATEALAQAMMKFFDERRARV